MGERNSYDDNMGDYVSWMSRNSTSVDGACGVLFNRSGATSDTFAGLRYIVPFRGAGTYSISCFAKDLHQTNSYRPAWDSGKLLVFECHPMDANKTRITGGFAIYAYQNDPIFGDEQYSGSHTFGATATRDNGNGTTTEIEIAYLEVRVFLQRNGSVRVSRLCLSKSDHFIYWNANEVSEERKKEAAQLATGIDIYSHKIMLTADKTVFQTNSGKEVAVFTGSGINAELVHARELSTIADDGHGVLIKDALAQFFGQNGIANIKFGVNSDGYAVLSYYDKQGKFLYNLGPDGIKVNDIREMSVEVIKAISTNVVAGKMGYSFNTGTRNGYAYPAPTDYEYLIFGGKEADHSAVYFTEGYTPTVLSGSTTLYLYHAGRVASGYAADSTHGLTNAAAGNADGKYFTSTQMGDGNGALMNLANGTFFIEDFKTAMIISKTGEDLPYMSIGYIEIKDGVYNGRKTLYTYETSSEVVKRR